MLRISRSDKPFHSILNDAISLQPFFKLIKTHRWLIFSFCNHCKVMQIFYQFFIFLNGKKNSSLFARLIYYVLLMKSFHFFLLFLPLRSEEHTSELQSQ